MYKVILNKIKIGDLKYTLRTSEVIGECDHLPVLNKEFMMRAPPLDPTAGDTRLILTTRVVDIYKAQGIISIRTESGSVYELQILLEDKTSNGY